MSVFTLKAPFRRCRVSECHRWSNPVRAPRVDIAPVFRKRGALKTWGSVRPPVQ